MIANTKDTNSVSYPFFTKLWLILLECSNLVLGGSFFYFRFENFPFLALALINIYSITLLQEQKKQGFYTLCTAQFIFLIYSLVTKKPLLYLRLSGLHVLLLIITFLTVLPLWKERKTIAS